VLTDSRIVDVRAAAMMIGPSAAELGPFETVLWMGVCCARCRATRCNRPEKRVSASYGAGVVRFLLADEQFPRALRVLPAPRRGGAATGCRTASRCCGACRACGARFTTRVSNARQGELHEFIDRLQVSLARTNDELARIYFSVIGAARRYRPDRAFQTQSQKQNKQDNGLAKPTL